MKSFRLFVHQKNFSEEDLIINPKDLPEAKKGDIVEIYHTPPESDKTKDNEEENPRLLLQIKTLSEEILPTKGVAKDTLSVEQSIATTFGLKIYKTVSVRIVNPADVALESIELTFKDQYMGRSEMWRLKSYLKDTCMYMNKKLEFCGGAIRCQVYEMWAQGERVACGILTEDTKIVFRSSTSMVYLFLQMSSEMWDFDIYGDLYYEKAVHGFLADLFAKWKKHGSNHEVTIVLFSRTFYEASSLEEFPHHMRECLQKDYKGRFYEDFYRVAVQNERYDDWCGILVQLRKIFSEYLKIVLEYHSRPNVSIPTATNSTAAQGNFLEVLNMSLNVFEKHYLDRSFDRTGQLSVVVTPGVGVFEVDRELTNITKQRIIDNGVGSDLVCVGEQPLHAVPLLKFHNKDAHKNVPDDYSMPHWINLSFYSSNKKIPHSNFVPRIKLPPITKTKKKAEPEDEYIHKSFFDYDAYDAQIFQQPPVHSIEINTIQSKLSYRYKRSSGSLLNDEEAAKFKRKLSDPDIQQKVDSINRSEPIAIPPALTSPVISPPTEVDEKKEVSPPVRMVVGSEGSPPLESKALINPFDPTHVTIKLTSNRRRWTHIFPKGPTGVLIQQHHYQAVPAQKQEDKTKISSENSSFCMMDVLNEYFKKKPNTSTPGINTSGPSKNPSKSLTYLWGATGEQEWTPALTTGVDWKSLTIPACLPITTDYFPDERALNIDYVVSLYSLVPDSVSADFAQQRPTYRKLLTTEEVFRELISQRLAQGFQLIVMENNEKTNSSFTSKQSVVRATTPENDNSYFLSIGRLFHKIYLSGNAIFVTRYRPRHPYPGFKYQYRYRFHAPHHDKYEESYALFTTEKLEHYNWNYLDHYICTGGDSEFVLVEALKYWRFRVYLVPANNPATKKIIEGHPHFNIYTLPTSTDYQNMVEGFSKFLETAINKIKRTQVCKKPRMSLNITNNAPLLQPRRNSMSNFLQNMNSSPFRERMDSNRMPDRPRLRSGSKVDRSRTSTMTQESCSSEAQGVDVFSEESSSVPGPVLKTSASNSEIIEAMKHPLNGVSFINMQQNLPCYTFVAAEAVTWLITHMEGSLNVEKAVQIMEGLHSENLICHASGNRGKLFQYGFYLFYICGAIDKDDKDAFHPNGDLSTFENEWLEVEIKSSLHWGIQQTPSNLSPATYTTGEYAVPHFLCEDINVDYAEEDIKGPLFKRIRLETDVSNKSDRVEWGHVKYQTVFRPDQAYEFIIEWLTSSGSIIAELLNSWNRKAQSCGLQMIPIPHDPLALPYSDKSDPLRGPIYIPLNANCLQKDDQLFKDFPEDTAAERLFLFQEAIVQRFGFLNCHSETSNSSSSSSREHQYVHCTGAVFVLFSCTTTRSRSRVTSMSKGRATGRYSVHADIVPSPHEAYITRHVSGKNKDDYDNSRKLGYLWSWNHMVSKRWRSNQAVDNNYLTRMLKDFREFCANVDNRLQEFLDECWEVKVAASAKNITL
ncbi:GATOR complex protein Iml1 isoform X2 [Harmonia axyridis]|uniref:GATOR complex protein Iml1 isoform X2 n=1 Tax=Harmonia axyridis TaxID=115357 RepID=UPI001E2794EF|nr:GATOR complex protein Iml1 isoform X2 [Harmonia axyridis]